MACCVYACACTCLYVHMYTYQHTGCTYCVFKRPYIYIIICCGTLHNIQCYKVCMTKWFVYTTNCHIIPYGYVALRIRWKCTLTGYCNSFTAQRIALQGKYTIIAKYCVICRGIECNRHGQWQTQARVIIIHIIALLIPIVYTRLCDGIAMVHLLIREIYTDGNSSLWHDGGVEGQRKVSLREMGSEFERNGKVSLRGKGKWVWGKWESEFERNG